MADMAPYKQKITRSLFLFFGSSCQIRTEFIMYSSGKAHAITEFHLTSIICLSTSIAVLQHQSNS